MLKQFLHILHNSAVPELQICCSEQKRIRKPGWDPSALPSALQTCSAVRQVVRAQESEVGNEVRGLLNPLLVCLSARPPINPNPRLVRSLCHSSALSAPHLLLSAHPPLFCVPSARQPICRPSAPLPPVCLPFVHPPLVRPRPHLPKITYHFLLLESFLPSIRRVRSPRLQFMAPARAIVALG